MTTITETTARRRIEQYNAAVDRTCAWIEQNRLPDGRWRQPASCAGYFSLVPFAVTVGRHDWALDALRLVQNTMLGEDGRLVQGANRDHYIAYVPAWYVWGAAETGALPFGRRVLEFVQSFQCKKTGGLFGSIAARDAGEGDFSFDATTMAAVAFARAGRADEAAAVAEFLLQMLDDQPRPDTVFYTDYHQPGGLATSDPAATSALQWDQPQQHYYKMGLFILALLEAYSVTGEDRYLAAAAAAYRTAADRAVNLYDTTLSHKMAWAATRLFAATFDPYYANEACRYADHLITLQQPDGAFNYPEFWPSYPPPAWESLPNVGCQFAMWIAMARNALTATLEP